MDFCNAVNFKIHNFSFKNFKVQVIHWTLDITVPPQTLSLSHHGGVFV